MILKEQQIFLEEMIKQKEYTLIFATHGQEASTIKKRLTHTRQLEKYKQFLKENGEIYFKTDDDNLFNDSISYFKSSGFEIIKNTYDLQDEPEFWDNIKTEHEDMFTEQGIKIKALIARVITN